MLFDKIAWITTLFTISAPLGRFSHRVAMSVCLWRCETPTSRGHGDLWLKNVFLILACDNNFFGVAPKLRVLTILYIFFVVENCVITAQYQEYTHRPEFATTSGRGCFETSQIDTHTHTHTDGHCGSITELAQWADSVKIVFTKISNRSKLCKPPVFVH